MFKKVRLYFIFFLLILSVLAGFYFELLSYGLAQGYGQLRIVWNARPIAEVMEDPATPDSIRLKLDYIGQVRKYAIDSLGLNDTENYTTYFDQGGKEILWVVTASEPYALKEKSWEFPVVGKVPYKGFFSPEKARLEAEMLKSSGLDISVRNPGGWSTLGWFKDPVLSGMLSRSKGDLASLIIHEMVHATIYVKDSSTFNENLASFIGDEGAKLFLRSQHGSHSEDLQVYLKEERDYLLWTNHFLRGAAALDTLYQSKNFHRISDSVKLILKSTLIQSIVEKGDTLSLAAMPKPSAYFKKVLPNNAYFLSFIRYQAMQTDFRTVFERDFQSNVLKMISTYREKFPFL